MNFSNIYGQGEKWDPNPNNDRRLNPRPGLKLNFNPGQDSPLNLSSDLPNPNSFSFTEPNLGHWPLQNCMFDLKGRGKEHVGVSRETPLRTLLQGLVGWRLAAHGQGCQSPTAIVLQCSPASYRNGSLRFTMPLRNLLSKCAHSSLTPGSWSSSGPLIPPVPASEAPEPNTDIIYFPKPNTARRLFLSCGILQPCNLTINPAINHKHSFYCLLPQLFSLAEWLHVRYILELSLQIDSNFSTIINNAETNILINKSLCIYILEELLSNQILKVKNSRNENQQCSVSFLPLHQDIHSSFSGFPGI